MKLTNITDVNDFLTAVKQCKGNVYLTSQNNDRYNLKSELSMFVAIGALIEHRANDLELWCDNKDDEAIMLTFFNTHKDSL